MPTYSYACTECGHRFDAQQAFTDDALTQCPQCGGRLRKMFGNVGVVFKGSGFYRTDARDDGRGGASPGKGAAPEKASTTGGSGGASSAAGSGGTAGSGSGGSGGTGSGSTGSGSTGSTAAAATA